MQEAHPIMIQVPSSGGPIWLEPEEITTIRALISEAQEQLATLRNRVNKEGAGSELKDLKIVEIASLRNILAPIRRMPLEIVSRIFMAYCSMNQWHYRWRGALYQGTCTRITLTSLWSEFKVHREGYKRSRWLNRSGNLPLEGNIAEPFLAFSHRIRSLEYIKLTEDGVSCLLENIKFPRDAVTSLAVVASSCHRIQFPNIYFDTLRSMNKLVHCTIKFPSQRIEIPVTFKPVILPLLQSLTLTTEWDEDTGYDVAFFRCLCAPLLKDLHLINKSVSYAELVQQLAGFRARSAVSLSSLHLSSFCGELISGEDIIPLVAVFPSIRILRIDETETEIGPLVNALVYKPARSGPLHLPNLEELYLEGSEVEAEGVCNLIQSYWRLIDEDNAQTLPDVENCTSRLRKARVHACHWVNDTDRFKQLERESALHDIEFEFHMGW
ncbi:hypothetical protein BDP27DRAFT_1311153 [Rhodocollybia butyracea]|uniref:F-box domain-containing protein n=1 Tax=Rhodocollybia butyracea TaxID=206335 RepID=A0A9P5QA53_9AGAR|nr:hypothetical protein BDP27DRAFT_1311153 [Rhodocollybia butyracea]